MFGVGEVDFVGLEIDDVIYYGDVNWWFEIFFEKCVVYMV